MIRLAGVVKEYARGLDRVLGRRIRALDEVTLDVAPGTALGIVGPNGAGKSTLIRLLLGYLHPTRGEVEIAGLPPRTYVERRGIGYVPERVEIPPRWTVRGALEAYAALGDLADPARRIEGVLQHLGLAEQADRRVRALSKGNLQRLALAQALLGEREILILDEPTDGLDPEWKVRTRELLTEWRVGHSERVLLFASHNLDEVERIADRVAVLREGRVHEVLDLREPPSSLPPYRLEIAASTATDRKAVEEIFPGATTLPNGGGPSAPRAYRVTAADLPDLNRRIARLIEDGATIQALTPERASLEQRYRRGNEG